MSTAASAESERNKKLWSQSKGRPTVPTIQKEANQPSNQDKQPPNDLLAAINVIKSEVKALKEEIHKPKQTSKGERREPWCCQGCKDGNIQRCNHCFKCGSESHFARGCCNQVNNKRLLAREQGTAHVKCLTNVTTVENVKDRVSWKDANSAIVCGIVHKSVRRYNGHSIRYCAKLCVIYLKVILIIKIQL